VAISHLDPALGCIAAGGEIVDFLIKDREIPPHFFCCPEEIAKAAEAHGWEHGPILYFNYRLDITPCRAASVIADTVNDEAGFKAAAFCREFGKAYGNFGGNAAVVPIGFAVGQEFFS
jgi:hypothetical protein